MIILGIDPGYAIVGAGVVDYTANQFRLVEAKAITTEAATPFDQRLREIYAGAAGLIAAHRPAAMAIEKLFFNTNTTTAIDVAQARGVLLLAAAQAGVPVYEYTPLQVKQSVVGYGRAEKRQVQDMVKLLLRLNACPKPDDVADALAIAICHAHSAGSLMRFMK
ncbi:MAG: crossover junction endodeoxyribonuclease RuvC [Oscillospiraceae bacterium]|nr:crossover junction endodeoxyribonuclease RuvC [Oscillospiraceae bacterium]MCL1952564.1 crossover junction endodeoxyribonuclease RuvC [Oscillospiraceae bacterium]